jgi:hypothetical protein
MTRNSTISGCTLHKGPLPAGVLTAIGTSSGALATLGTPAGALTTLGTPAEALTTTRTPSVSSSANYTGNLPNVPPLAVDQINNHRTSFSRGAAAGVGVAATIVVLTLILAALCFLRRRQRANLLEENTVIENPTPETRLYGSMRNRGKD